jgi:SAM-dependent methyltransferase
MTGKSESTFSISSIYRYTKTALKLILPNFIKKPIISYLNNRQVKEKQRIYKNLSTKEVFTKIYKNNMWGGVKGEYFSGTGSLDPSVNGYTKIIKDFIIKHKITRVVDLGCGDFRVGQQIIMPGMHYIGTDIVKPLIDHNKLMYSNENISFLCLDVIKDELPEGQLCLIRQVLQHLSNQEIVQIIKKIKQYRYVIITEHMPDPHREIIPNKDIPHGPDTRISYDSAVYLNRFPFNVKISKILLDTEMKDYCRYKGERLRTFLVEYK